MGLIGRVKSAYGAFVKSDLQQDQDLLDELGQNGTPKKPKEVKSRARHAGMVYNSSLTDKYGRQTTYLPPEYDMSSIANAIDTDSYFRRSVEKYVELLWKSGYKMIGKNQNAVNYLRRRFEQIAMVSDLPTKELFKQISYQIITYANVFISKVRDSDASGGSYRTTFNNKRLAPVAAYFVEDTVSMKISVKDNGDALAYKQEIPGKSKYKIWRPWNMMHFYYSKKPGLNWGTPMVWPVLDDIRALRKMEQNVELLVFQHTIPLYLYKIGTDERPAQDPEITAMQAELERMPPNGALVVPERHNVEVLGAERAALDVTKYLAFFKQRVLAGLGMSAVGMGEGDSSNKSTASVIDKHMHNTTEMFQEIITMFVDQFIIKELLAEGGYFYDAFNEDNKVTLFFPPIDKEAQYAKENHYTQLYAQNAILEDELRFALGRDAISDEDRKNMYFELIEKPKALILAADEAFLPKSNITSGPTTGSNKSKPTSNTKSNAAEKTGKNREQPTNQYKTLLTRPSIAKNDTAHDVALTIYESTKDDILDAYLDYLKDDKFVTDILKSVKNNVFNITKKTIRDSLSESQYKNKQYFIDKSDEIFDNLYEKVEQIFKIKDSQSGVTKIVSTFGSVKNRFDILCDNHLSHKENEDKSDV